MEEVEDGEEKREDGEEQEGEEDTEGGSWRATSVGFPAAITATLEGAVEMEGAEKDDDEDELEEDDEEEDDEEEERVRSSRTEAVILWRDTRALEKRETSLVTASRHNKALGATTTGACASADTPCWGSVLSLRATNCSLP